jgi:uncharacterized OB-fold protein
MRERMKLITPFISAAVILTTGFDALDTGRSFGYACLACGLIYLIPIVLMAMKKIREERWMEWAGALIVTTAAIDYFLKEKRALSFAYLVAAVLTVVIPAWVRRYRARKQASETVET